MKIIPVFFLLLSMCAAPILPRDDNCKGMTWIVKNHFGQFVRVGNDKFTNPYHGDTSCGRKLPILAVKVTGAARPDLEGIKYDYYQGWCWGYLKLTPPVSGRRLTSLVEANRIIREYLGAGWRMAEHHDGGGGWSFWGYGFIPGNTRFWVYINDQRANPWNSVSGPRLTRSVTRERKSTRTINLGRLKSTTVAVSSVNGNRHPNNALYGVRNLFDGGRHMVNGINYTTWLSDRDAGHWVKIKFREPVTLHKIMVECLADDSDMESRRPREFAVNITTFSDDEWEVDKRPSTAIHGFRFYYPLGEPVENVVEVEVVFPGRGMVEVSEIEVLGVPKPGSDRQTGLPAAVRW
jgi:hypothetical protein